MNLTARVPKERAGTVTCIHVRALGDKAIPPDDQIGTPRCTAPLGVHLETPSAIPFAMACLVV